MDLMKQLEKLPLEIVRDYALIQASQARNPNTAYQLRQTAREATTWQNTTK